MSINTLAVAFPGRGLNTPSWHSGLKKILLRGIKLLGQIFTYVLNAVIGVLINTRNVRYCCVLSCQHEHALLA